MIETNDVLEAPPGWITLEQGAERLAFLNEADVVALIEQGWIEAVRERQHRGWRYLVRENSLTKLAAGYPVAIAEALREAART